MVHATKRKRKPKGSNNAKIIITIFTGLIMITSIIGFLGNGNDDPNAVLYGNYSFSQVQGTWITQVNDQKTVFYSSPYDAEKFNITQDAIQAIKNSPAVYVTFDPEIKDIQYIDIARFDLAEDLKNKFNIVMLSGISSMSTVYPLEIIDCNNATAKVPVIYFKEGNKTEVSYFGNCLVLEAPSSQLNLRLKDRLMYGLYGIIK